MTQLLSIGDSTPPTLQLLRFLYPPRIDPDIRIDPKGPTLRSGFWGPMGMLQQAPLLTDVHKLIRVSDSVSFGSNNFTDEVLDLDGAEGLSIETSSSQHLIRESQESVNYHELVVSKLKRKNINFSSQLECLECGRILGNATHGRDHVYNQHIPLTVPRFTCQFVDCRSRFKSNYESSALRHSREAGKKVFCDRCENWYSRNSYKNGQHQGSCRPRS